LKKFFIAIFCCFIINISFAAVPDTDFEPKISDYATKWLTGGTTYSTKLNMEMASGGYSLLQSQLDSKNNGTYNTQHAIYLWAAKEIYEHGAKICQVQIQASNVRIDYYWRDNWKCATLCEANYSGDQCQTYGEKAPCDEDIILQSEYALIKYGDDDDKDTNRHTDAMQVLKFENGTIVNSSSDYSTHVILGINKKMSHGAIVTPIEIQAISQTNTYSLNGSSYTTVNTRITSVYSNGKETLLCQEGYIPNANNTNCVQTNECKINTNNMCDGYSKSEYTEDAYVLKAKKLQTCSGKVCRTTGTCTYYECRDGYGLESPGSKKCINCSNNGQGINNDGVCIQCTGEKRFILNGECETADKEFSKSQMRQNSSSQQCWIEIDPDRYKECVI